MIKEKATTTVAAVFFLTTWGTLLLFNGSVYPANGYSIKGFVGTSPQTPAIGQEVVLLDAGTGKALRTAKTDIFAKYSFKGLGNGTYIVKVGKIKKRVTLEGKNIRLDIDMSAPDGTMDYSGRRETVSRDDKTPERVVKSKERQDKSAIRRSTESSELARQIAGIWWGYAGSTERKIGLCPGGIYQDYSESSYSGGSSDSLGNRNMN